MTHQLNPQRRDPRHGERGSAAVEAVILVPAIMLIVLMAVAGGRYALARQSVEAAAAAAARSASLARDPGQAQSDATANAAATLANEHLNCLTTQVLVDTGAFSLPVGTPGQVSATVSCTVNLSDLSVPGLPGSATVTATMSSPLDTYRGR